MFTSSRAGSSGRRGLESRGSEADRAANRADPCDIVFAHDRRSHFATALILGLAGVSQLRIGAMLQQQIRAFLVIQDAAEPVALTGRRKPRRHAGLADRIHVHAQIDHLRQQRVPAAIGGTEQGVFAGGCCALRDPRRDRAET